MSTTGRWRGPLVALCALGLLAATPSADAAAPTHRALYLVTLTGPGVAGHPGPDAGYRATLRAQQDRVLARIDAGAPAYRWTTALNGFSVELSDIQAQALLDDPRVQMVETNSVRRLAGRATTGADRPVSAGPGGGAGEVVGVVDTGIWRTSPLFAPAGHVARVKGFRGACAGGAGWSPDDCNAKLVGARWFVRGFGTGQLRTGTPLSASDDSGHGTAVSSIAVGDAGVSVAVPGQRLGSYRGVAPRARLAVYKACWTAPDPDDDGCATADLVTAIDRATRDGVDVLNLAVGGPPRVDTVELALLGAAEADVVVVAAAGNDGARAYAAHPVPWVTTVGASASDVRRGQAVAGGRSWTGAMTARQAVGPAPVVLGRQAAAAGATRAEAAACVPGSLDVARTARAVVVCNRGRIGRVEKSAAVRAADGVGMVLVNTERGSVTADLHAVPTVHLTHAAGRSLEHWVVHHPRARISLRPDGHTRAPRAVAWSSSGDPTGGLVKPDLLGPGVGVLAAAPPGSVTGRWTLLSGTSAATASVAGTAAVLRSRHHWSAARIRSVLATTAAPVRAGVLRQGSGLLQSRRRPGLVLDQPVSAYRAWLADPGQRLNSASLLLPAGATRAHRVLTNVSGRSGYWSSAVRGFSGHRVTVTPAAVRLSPGERTRFTVHVSGTSPAVDDGWVVWTGADGTTVRVPVVLSR